MTAEFRCPCNGAPPIPLPEAPWSTCPACGDRGYQGLIVQGVYRRITEGYSRILVAMGTGLGKTRTVRRIIQQAVAEQLAMPDGSSRSKRPRRVLFIVHREELVIQTAGELSGLKPDQVSQALGDGQLQMGHGVPHAGIGVVKAGHRERREAIVQIAGPKSMPTRAWVLDWLAEEDSLIVVDEAHTVAFYEEVYPLLQNLMPGTVTVLLTATPSRSDGRQLAEVADAVVRGPLPAAAQEQGFLVPFRYKSVTTRQNVNPKQDSAALVQAYLTEASDRQGIVFCSSVSHAKAVSKAFLDAGVSSACIDGGLTPKKRIPIYQAFRAGELQVITCDDILTAGVDFPFVSYIGLLGYVGAWSTLIQILGRGSRPSPGKADCLVHDAGRNVEALGGLEDVTTDDYGVDGQAGVRPERVRKQCPQCALILPVSSLSCACGYQWSLPLVPMLNGHRGYIPGPPDGLSPGFYWNARKVYANCLRKAMREGHSPSTARRKAEYVLKVEKLEVDIRHALYWPPTAENLEEFSAYLQAVAAKPNRKGNEKRDDAWMRNQLHLEFREMLAFKGES